APEPPAPSDYVRLYFPHSDWPEDAGNYTQDIRPYSTVMSWTFDVQSTFADAPITLTWDVSQVPAEYTVVRLIGWEMEMTPPFPFVEGDVIVADMRTTTEYQYTNTAFQHDRFTFEALVNQAPEVEVTYPNGGETINGVVDVTANASAPVADEAAPLNDAVVSVLFEYSADAGTSWTEIGTDIDGADGWSYSWDAGGLADGEYLVRATATDSYGATSSDTSDAACDLDNLLWLANLSAAIGVYSDNVNYAGMAYGASEEYDSTYDAPEPPAPSDYVRLYFPHSDWETLPGDYDVDVRPVSAEAVWDFEVQTNQTGDVTLTWDISEIPAEYGFVLLIDTQNGPFGPVGDPIVTNMRTESSYVFTPMAPEFAQEFQFVVGYNNPPTVEVTSPNAGATVGGNVTVTADATPPAADEAWPYLDEVVSVAFEYSHDGGTTWTAIDTDNDGGDGWSAVWNSITAPVEGSDYYVRATATDSGGATASDTSGPFTLVYMLTAETTFLTGWNMVGIPVDAPQVENNYVEILGDDIPTLYIFWYNPTEGRYVGWNAGPPPTYNNELGKGFWIRVYEDTPVDAEGFPAADEPFVIHLLPGWNQIGTPFNYSVDWGDVTVYNPDPDTGGTLPIYADGEDNDAHDMGWVLKYIYGYSPLTGGYVTAQAPDGALEVWHGYWVRVLVECDLIVPNTPLP
ncbi:hypothetical protein ACFLTS_05865, partial [Chloroflexota bacterium]